MCQHARGGGGILLLQRSGAGIAPPALHPLVRVPLTRLERYVAGSPMPKKAYKRTVRRKSKKPSLQTCLNHAAELVNGSVRSNKDDDEGGSSGCFPELPLSPGRPPNELASPSPLLLLLPVSRAPDPSTLEEYGEPDIGVDVREPRFGYVSLTTGNEQAATHLALSGTALSGLHVKPSPWNTVVKVTKESTGRRAEDGGRW